MLDRNRQPPRRKGPYKPRRAAIMGGEYRNTGNGAKAVVDPLKRRIGALDRTGRERPAGARPQRDRDSGPGQPRQTPPQTEGLPLAVKGDGTGQRPRTAPADPAADRKREVKMH